METRQPTTSREYTLVSSLYRVAHYNIACCYSALEQASPTTSCPVNVQF